jgi:hypothetical protein
MSRVFAYCRVSTADQTTENQTREITTAGFAVTPSRTIEETISGSVPASERPGLAHDFAGLVSRACWGQLLASIEATHQFRYGQVQGVGQPCDVMQADISLASFDRAHVVGVKVREFSQLLLRKL